VSRDRTPRSGIGPCSSAGTATPLAKSRVLDLYPAARIHGRDSRRSYRGSEERIIHP
jgi:hypothetical protein